MKKKTACLIVIVLLIAYITLSFIPCLIESTVWEIIEPGAAKSTGRSEIQNFLSQISISYTGVSRLASQLPGYLAILSNVLSVASIVGFVLLIGEKSKNITKYFSWAPCVALVTHMLAAIILFGFTHPSYELQAISYCYTSFDPAWGFYIHTALIAVAAGLSALVSLNKLKDEPNEVKTSNISKTYIEELKNLKELLDSGIITQEEFDAKKKQIMGL